MTEKQVELLRAAGNGPVTLRELVARVGATEAEARRLAEAGAFDLS